MDRSTTSTLPFVKSIGACAWGVVAIGCLVFFGGWVLDVTALKNVIPGTVVMKASTAFALASIGASLLLLRTPDPPAMRRDAGLACAAFPLAVPRLPERVQPRVEPDPVLGQPGTMPV